MSNAIAASDLIREVRAVANGRPDFAYTDQEEYDPRGSGCSYIGPTIGSRDGEGCIVGQALGRLNFDMEEVAKWEDSAASDGGTGVGELVSHFKIPGHPSQVDWLRAVQRNQDRGESWAWSVRNADNYYPITGA